MRDMARLPGVTSVTVSQWPLYNNAEPKFPVCVPAVQSGEHMMDIEPVAPRFFETWGVRLLRGRDFVATDSKTSAVAAPLRVFDDGAVASRGAHVAIVNATFVRAFYGSSNPIGQQIGIGACPGDPKTIVGVVADHVDRPRMPITPMVYVPFPSSGVTAFVTFALRAPTGTPGLIAQLRQVMASENVQVDGDVMTGAAYREREWRRERMLSTVLGLFTVFAVIICCLGVYGIVEYAVRSRAAELGVRSALGATSADAIRLVMTDSFMSVSAGAIIGTTVAIASARWISGLLFGVTAWDAWTLLGAISMLSITVAAAAFLPGRKAGRIDPAITLRYP
jgi:putative ABC transport system permease protein